MPSRDALHGVEDGGKEGVGTKSEVRGRVESPAGVGGCVLGWSFPLSLGDAMHTQVPSLAHHPRVREAVGLSRSVPVRPPLGLHIVGKMLIFLKRKACSLQKGKLGC